MKMSLFFRTLFSSIIFLGGLVGCGAEVVCSMSSSGGGQPQKQPQRQQPQQLPESGGTLQNTGKTGSTARFTVLNDRLYTLSSGRIVSFDISTPSQPVRSGAARVAMDIETLFNDGKHLFVGAETALHILSVENPDLPKLIGQHPHARACDPVVTSGEYAFVTLRSGSRNCNAGVNVLKVINISMPKRPVEVQRISMHKPSGLGVAKDRLFVCDAEHGLAEFDISRPAELRELSRVRDEFCSDVIPLEKVLITTGESGITQYNIENETLLRLSRIEAEK